MSSKNKLNLSHVTLNNFRAYSGKIEFDLSLDPSKTITIIHGEMGMGKTTILDSIYWCLYGKERSKKGDISTEEGIVNTNVLERLNINEKNETFIEILLHDNEGIRYKIKRSIKFSKNSESVNSISNNSIGGKVPSGIIFTSSVDFHYLHPDSSGDADWDVFSNPDIVEEKIEKIFPKALSSYFLFDAELLHEFFYTDTGEHVKNGIEKISGLLILDDARDHLKNTSKKIDEIIANKDVNTKPIADDMAKLEDGIVDFKNRLEVIKKRMIEIKTQKKIIQDYLRQHDDQEINNLQKNKDTTNEILQKINLDLKSNELEIKKMLLHLTPRLLLRDTIAITESKFHKWENQKKIPLAVTKIALQNIINSSPPTCICGTVLEDNSVERQNIDDLMNRVIDSGLIQHITVGRSILSNVMDQTEVSNLSKNFGELQSKRFQFRNLRAEKKSELNVIETKFDEHDIDEVQEKTKELHLLEKEESILFADKKGYEEKIKFGENDFVKYKRKLDMLTGKSNKYQNEKNKARLARILSKILDDCRKDLVVQLRTLTAEKTTQYFLNLVSKEGDSKKSDFMKVKILPNYQTVALDNNEKIKSLSAGQSCCLALAYIAAIREIANRDYFMMIDSPLHNISAEERIGIAQNLPSFIPGTQITLLVQDQEYTGRAKKKITGEEIPSVRDTLCGNQSVWREYLLELDKTSKDTVTNTTIRAITGDE